MYAVIEKSLGGLTLPYYLRHLCFALIFQLMLFAQVNHQPGSGGMFLLAVVNTLLYPYARFLYERVWGFIMGDTKFMLGVLWVSLGKLATMMACWCLAVSWLPSALYTSTICANEQCNSDQLRARTGRRAEQCQ